jgi:hypothetical protein
VRFDTQAGRRAHWRQVMSIFLIAAFAMRAFIPAGYMPDFKAFAAGTFKVVICTATGVKSLAIDATTGQPVEQQAGHPEQPCAFSGLAAIALPDITIAAAPCCVPVVAPSLPQREAEMPPARAGPANGSRAPPEAA